MEARRAQELQGKQCEQQADIPASRERDPIREKTEGTATASSSAPEQPKGWQVALQRMQAQIQVQMQTQMQQIQQQMLQMQQMLMSQQALPTSYPVPQDGQ